MNTNSEKIITAKSQTLKGETNTNPTADGKRAGSGSVTVKATPGKAEAHKKDDP